MTVCPNKNTWGLSYDDGPSPDTPRLLNFLDAQTPALKTTFFIVGSRAISRPSMLQYEYLDGHQLCVVRPATLLALTPAAHLVAHRPHDTDQRPDRR